MEWDFKEKEEEMKIIYKLVMEEKMLMIDSHSKNDFLLNYKV